MIGNGHEQQRSNLVKMPSFTIKLTGTEDIPVIISIQERTWGPTYGQIISKDQLDFMFNLIYSPESLATSMVEHHHHYLLLFVDEVPSGFASVSEQEPGHFKLHKIYVLPSTQGTGAGKYLLNEAEKYVRNSGGSKLSLNVNRYNKAKGFYEKMNYAVVRQEDIPIGPYWMNDYVLEKQLS